MDHTRVIRWLRVLLPLAALAILSGLFLLGRSPDPERAIPYADGAAGDRTARPGMTAPDYAGVTAGGATLTLRAARADPAGDSGSASQVMLDWRAPDGLAASVTAGAATLDTGRIALAQGVRATLSSGWVLTAPAMTADTATDRLSAPAQVAALAPFGRLTAGGMVLSRGPGGAHVLELNGGVRLLYQP